MAVQGVSPPLMWILTLGLTLPTLGGCQSGDGPGSAPTSQFVETPGNIDGTPTQIETEATPSLTPTSSPPEPPTPTASIDDDGDGASLEDGDCDDANPEVYPGATEGCDGLDNDCDRRADEGVLILFYPDNDGDTFGTNEGVVAACEPPASYSDRNGDCDDLDPVSSPEGTETCGAPGADEDCDGLIDEGVGIALYPDADGDGVGDATGLIHLCDIPEGFVEAPGDCADGDPEVAPGFIEYCHDGRDNDCDGAILPCESKGECLLGDCPTLIGTVISGLGGAGLPGALIQLSLTDAPGVELDVLTNAEGDLRLEGIPEGLYEGVIDAEGHQSEALRLDIGPGVRRLWTLPLTPEGSPSTGQIRSLVKDASTGLGVDGVSVSVFEGLGVGDGLPILRDTTTPSVLDIPLDVGNYTLALSRAGYEDIHYPVYVSGNAIDLKDLALSPFTEAGALRATLTWGSAPRDLDLYLEHRDDAGALMYTVYYGGRQAEGATLDLDDRNGSGPETITLSHISPEGSYQFIVRDYSNRDAPDSLELAHSGAELILYDGEQMPLRVAIPLEAGTLWRPLTIDGGEAIVCIEGCVEGE